MSDPTVDEEIHVQSSQVDLGDALVEHCRARVLAAGSKYFGKVTRATVHFRHEGQAFACTVKMRSGGLEPHAAECVDRDARRAFNMALEKVAKQLRREKRVVREDKPHRPGKDAR